MARIEWARNQRNRARIAQAAARLIAEHGLADWSMAKRKACRQLGLGEKEALPGDDEVQQALRDYNSLFRPAAHAEDLRRHRRSALRWMERLQRWNPVLVGGVAAGWATQHSDVRLELEADDTKAVELALINAGIDYSPGQAGKAPPGELFVGQGAEAVRLIILTPQQRRNRLRRDEDQRMTLGELRLVLDVVASPGEG